MASEPMVVICGHVDIFEDDDAHAPYPVLAQRDWRMYIAEAFRFIERNILCLSPNIHTMTRQ